MPGVDDRPEPEGLGNDARLARWVKAHVPNDNVRQDGEKLVGYRGGELYALLYEVAEHFYWLGTGDVKDHDTHMREFWAAAKTTRRGGRT